jgi:hypothetical protein
MKLQVLPVEQQLLDQLYLAATATGVYTISDLSLGMFGSSCYGDNPAFSASSKVTWFYKICGVEQISMEFLYLYYYLCTERHEKHFKT